MAMSNLAANNNRVHGARPVHIVDKTSFAAQQARIFCSWYRPADVIVVRDGHRAVCLPELITSRAWAIALMIGRYPVHRQICPDRISTILWSSASGSLS